MIGYLPYILAELLLGAAFVALLSDESPATGRLLAEVGDLIRDVIDMIRRWWGVSGRHVRYEGRHVGAEVTA